MTPAELARLIDEQLCHIWMVRTFIKHSDEGQEDDDLREVYRELYDFAHALGPAFERQDWDEYVKLARKKLRKLIAANELYQRVQPEISSHTNFQMAGRSLQTCVAAIRRLLEPS
jgi:cob(I)alamin adenosyltransferase